MSCQSHIAKFLNTRPQVWGDFLDHGYPSDFSASSFDVIPDYNYTAYLTGILSQADITFSKRYTSSDPIENIFSIVTSNKYSRRGDYSKADYTLLLSTIKKQIAAAVSNNIPIGLVVPGFTTKCFNVLRVESRRLPDLAEFASLVRLYEICYQIKKVYPPGAQFIVVTDGLAYANIFGEDPYFAIAHRNTMQNWLNRTGMDAFVKLVDLTTLLPADFTDHFLQVGKDLAREWSGLQNSDYLINYIANTKDLVNFESEIAHDLKLFYHFQIAHSEHLSRTQIDSNILLKSLKTTFLYETFLRTSYKLNIISGAFPDYLRCTGRPKPGQLGIHMIHERSNNFPWNGVAVVLKSGRIDVFAESQVKYSTDFTPVFIEGDHSAFYYRQN